MQSLHVFFATHTSFTYTHKTCNANIHCSTYIAHTRTLNVHRHIHMRTYIHSYIYTSYAFTLSIHICPSRLRCSRLWLRTIAGKSTCGGSVAFPWEAHPKGGDYDGV